jgi:hypothetical protein
MERWRYQNRSCHGYILLTGAGEIKKCNVHNHMEVEQRIKRLKYCSRYGKDQITPPNLVDGKLAN